MSKGVWEQVAPGVSLSAHPSGERNRWRVRIHAGTFAAGDQVRSHRTFSGTKRQATSFGVEERRRLAGQPRDPERRRIGPLVEEVIERKRQLAARGDLSPTTVYGHEKKFNKYIKPHPIARLEVRKLDAIDGPAHIVRWLNDLAEIRQENGKPLSTKTILHVFHTLTTALRYAMAIGLIEKDPLRQIPRELRPKAPPNGRPSRRSIGSVGQKGVMAAFAGHRDEAAIALALLGLRRGEVLGLRIRNSDEDATNGDVVLDGPRPLVRVRQVVVYAKGGTRIKAFPKTEASRRDVVLPSWAVRALKEQKRRSLELRLASGESWEEHDLLFPSTGKHRHNRTRGMVGGGIPGRPQHPNALYIRFKNQLKKHGIEGFDAERIAAIRLHDLRHTAVSVLINEAGMRAEDVQRVVGHADLKTTQAYRAIDDEPANQAAAAFDAILGS
ncbi:MAG: tyrosine-type recombinase/integrase [Vicinamibacterales bacterium]